MAHVAANLLTLSLLILALSTWAVHHGRVLFSAAGPLTRAACVHVPRGTGIAALAQYLARQGAVTSPLVFRAATQLSGNADALKAGAFIVPADASMADILDRVTDAGAPSCAAEVVWRIGISNTRIQLRSFNPAAGILAEQFNLAVADPVPSLLTEAIADHLTRFRIVVAEGATVRQVMQGLASTAILRGEITVSPDEGTLATSGFAVHRGMARDNLITTMEAVQQRALEEAWSTRAADLPLESPQEMLVLASLIEKETGQAEERRRIAGVFANRLRRGMRLQSDPTVLYGITRGQPLQRGGLTRRELRTATPWNTYVIDGLPPTPIANPGSASIRAAAQPEAHEYLYFVADGTGGHAFASTLDEHNRNVARWRRIETERMRDRQ